MHPGPDLREGATAGASSIEQGALVRRAHSTEQNPDAPNPQPHAPQRLADAGGMFSFGGAEAEVFDEAAERRAFQEAVARVAVRWRRRRLLHREMRRFLAGRRIRRGRRAGGLPGGRGGLADARRASRASRATSSPKKLNTVGRTANDVADELARQLDAMNAEAEASLRRRRREAEASLAEVERLRAAATEPLVLEAVDSDSDVEDAPQSCRIVHETTALGSNHADEAAYFVDGARVE